MVEDDAMLDEAHLLDELVPPPGPRWRRTVGWMLFVGAVVALTAGWQSGRITPRLEDTSWSHWGGTGPVSVGVAFRNGSPTDIEIVGGPHDRPGLELVGYATGTYEVRPESGMVAIDPGIDVSDPGLVGRLDDDPFPHRLAPGQGVVLTMVFDVTDCDAIAATDGSDDAIDLRMRMASGPLRTIEHRREVAVRKLIAPSSWPYEVARYACGFSEPGD